MSTHQKGAAINALKEIQNFVNGLEKKNFTRYKLTVTEARPFNLLGQRKVILTCQVFDKHDQPVKATVLKRVSDALEAEMTTALPSSAYAFRGPQDHVYAKFTFLMPSYVGYGMPTKTEAKVEEIYKDAFEMLRRGKFRDTLLRLQQAA